MSHHADPRATAIMFFDNGNYSRSPAAQVMGATLAARHGLADRFTFGSGGLIAKHVGDPPDPRTVSICNARGYTLEGFVCRQAQPADFAVYDHILAMDRQNLASLQLARREGDRAQVALFLGDDEVPDPFFGGEAGFVAVLDMIEARVKALLGLT